MNDYITVYGERASDVYAREAQKQQMANALKSEIQSLGAQGFVDKYGKEAAQKTLSMLNNDLAPVDPIAFRPQVQSPVSVVKRPRRTSTSTPSGPKQPLTFTSPQKQDTSSNKFVDGKLESEPTIIDTPVVQGQEALVRDKKEPYDSIALQNLTKQLEWQNKMKELHQPKQQNELPALTKAALATDDILVPVIDSATSLGRMAREGLNNIYGYATGEDMTEANRKLYENAETFRKDGIFGGFYSDDVKDRYNNSSLGKTTKSIGNFVQGAAEYANPVLRTQTLVGLGGSALGNRTDNEALKHLGNLNGQSRKDSWLKGYEGAIPTVYNVAKAGLKTAAKSAANGGDDVLKKTYKFFENRLRGNRALERAGSRPFAGSNYTPSYTNNPMNRGGEEFAKEMGKFFDNPRLQTSQVPMKTILDNAYKGANPKTLQRQLNADLRQKSFPHSF